MTSANERQVDGGHYRNAEGEAHWDRVTRLEMPWTLSNVTKHAERALYKGEMRTDLEKLIHYGQKALEQLNSGAIRPRNEADPDFLKPPAEETIPTRRRARSR